MKQMILFLANEPEDEDNVKLIFPVENLSSYQIMIAKTAEKIIKAQCWFEFSIVKNGKKQKLLSVMDKYLAFINADIENIIITDCATDFERARLFSNRYIIYPFKMIVKNFHNVSLWDYFQKKNIRIVSMYGESLRWLPNHNYFKSHPVVNLYES